MNVIGTFWRPTTRELIHIVWLGVLEEKNAFRFDKYSTKQSQISAVVQHDITSHSAYNRHFSIYFSRNFMHIVINCSSGVAL